MYVMLAQSYGPMEAKLMKAAICHQRLGMYYFVKFKFGKRMEIGYNSGTMTYTILCRNDNLDRRTWEQLVYIRM